jgi:malonate-semialdehyde dehydrogenase (acetylating) / methylmalonate-semialdehyde dehydrogenase
MSAVTSATKSIQHFIGGKHTAGSGNRFGSVYDPATGEVSGRVAFAEKADVDAAVAAAAAAFPGWAKTTPLRRARVLFNYKALLETHLDEIAELIMREHGKVFSDAKGEVTRGLEVVEFACGIPHLLKGEFSENVGGDIDSYSLHQPLGVCVGITPFNFPAMVPMWMFPVAIACGNTFVLKPSERDPSASLLLAEMWAEAGLPAGVFNVLQGDKVAVDGLLDHPDVAAVSFVGSTPIARYVHGRATANGKRVQALGGAKNHAIVLPDADLEFASDHLAAAAYGSAGERCMAISATIAVGSAGDDLIDVLDRRSRAVRVGPGRDAGTDMGPIVTQASKDRIVSLVTSGEESGAKVVVDGRDLVVPGHEKGFFVGPTLVDQVSPEMDVYREEVFGPVLSVLRAESYDDALELVNTNEYGNGAAIFTNDGGAARRFEAEVEAGMVGVNVPIPVPMAYFSFGGWKNSLFGDSHAHGTEGVHFFTRGKVVTSRWADPDHGGLNLGFPRND